MVIVAGYTKEMEDFINSNPGLKSRFNKYIEFPDYSTEELISIFNTMASSYQFKLSKDAIEILTKRIEKLVSEKNENFANARDVRNLFEQVISNQANRLATGSGDVDLTLIIGEDFKEVE